MGTNVSKITSFYDSLDDAAGRVRSRFQCESEIHARSILEPRDRLPVIFHFTAAALPVFGYEVRLSSSTVLGWTLH